MSSNRNTVGDYLGKRVSWSTKSSNKTSDEKFLRKLVDNAIASEHQASSSSCLSAATSEVPANANNNAVSESVSADTVVSLPVSVPLFSDDNKTAKRLHDHHLSNRQSDEAVEESKSRRARAMKEPSERRTTSSSTGDSRTSQGSQTKKRKNNKDDNTALSSRSLALSDSASQNSDAHSASSVVQIRTASGIDRSNQLSTSDDAFLDSLHRSLVNAETHSDSINLMYGSTTALLNSSTIKTATSASSQGPIPKQLRGSYSNDYNLLDANATIVRKFELTRLQERLALQQRLVEIERCLQQMTLRIVERKSLEKECEQIIDTMESCSESKEQTYRNEVASILNRYQQLGPRVRIIRFGKNTKDITPAGQDRERVELIEQFLEIARKYIDVQVTRVLPNDRSCTNCNLSGNELAVDDEGVSCCPRCGLERLFAYNCPVPIEELPSSRSEYEDRKNLYKALMRYQGKQPNKLPQSLEGDLNEYFRSFNLPIGSDIRTLPLNPKGTRGNTSLQLMFRALSETGHAEHYENCNLICAQYWGWMLPDVSHLEDIIMSDYDATQAVYERMIRKRKSSINTQFRLFKHLQARGHPCSLSDFKVVTTPDILAALEEMWREMVEGAKVDGLRYIPTL